MEELRKPSEIMIGDKTLEQALLKLTLRKSA